MNVQEAVDAPRFVTHSFPGSFEPHPYYPGGSMSSAVSGPRPARRSRRRATWSSGYRTCRSGLPGVCAIVADREAGILYGGADPRHAAYAMGC
jgi:gamma-glutamyltranspeptidase/glutathione hydrolase